MIACTAVIFLHASCETGRRPVGPEAHSTTSERPQSEIEKFETKSLFGGMDGRR